MEYRNKIFKITIYVENKILQIKLWSKRKEEKIVDELMFRRRMYIFFLKTHHFYKTMKVIKLSETEIAFAVLINLLFKTINRDRLATEVKWKQ